MSKLLVIDTETGGLDPLIHSILSLAGVVWEDGIIKDECEVFIVEGPLVVTAEAMRINQIDLTAHIKKAKPPREAAADFFGFARGCFDRKCPIVLTGHNVGFDVGFLKRLCRLGGFGFESFFSHRTLDTASILRFLFLLGKVPESATSSTGGFELFHIQVPDELRHTALGDARATAELLTRMIELVRDGGVNENH